MFYNKMKDLIQASKVSYYQSVWVRVGPPVQISVLILITIQSKKPQNPKIPLNQTKPNQTKPNQTKPNQTKPNKTKPNETKPN